MYYTPGVYVALLLYIAWAICLVLIQVLSSRWWRHFSKVNKMLGFYDQSVALV